MEPGLAIVALAAIGCGTGIVCMVIDKVAGARQRGDRQRVAFLEQRVADLERENRHLTEQIEWHMRLELEKPRSEVRELGAAG
jgi:hypothetical protein